MQVTDLEDIKAALWEQSHHPCTQVKWGMAQVMAVRRGKKGHLQALLRGWGRWYLANVLKSEHFLRVLLKSSGKAEQ